MGWMRVFFVVFFLPAKHCSISRFTLIRKTQDCSPLKKLTVWMKRSYMISRLECGLLFPNVEFLILFSL